jgi:hypothetical protein
MSWHGDSAWATRLPGPPAPIGSADLAQLAEEAGPAPQVRPPAPDVAWLAENIVMKRRTGGQGVLRWPLAAALPRSPDRASGRSRALDALNGPGAPRATGFAAFANGAVIRGAYHSKGGRPEVHRLVRRMARVAPEPARVGRL